MFSTAKLLFVAASVLSAVNLIVAADSSTSPPVHVRINKTDAALLVVDHQIGLFQLVKDYEPEVFRSAILAHAALGKVFDLPTILTTSAEVGPNGPLPKEIVQMHPNAPIIRRNGEVNAWDNEEFRNAVRKTGKKQLIIGGIVTDVCTAFLALSLVEEGYTVFANAEASGTISQRVADDANARMRAAGVHVLSAFAVAADLMRDWRNTPGAPEMFPYFDTYNPTIGYLVRGHVAAIDRGVKLPGESE